MGKQGGRLLVDHPRVVVAFSRAEKSMHEMRRGVMQYARLHGQWNIRFVNGHQDDLKLSDIKKGDCDGVIATTLSEGVESLAALDVPVVLHDRNSGDESTTLKRLLGKSARIVCDNADVGRVAAEFYLSTPYERFAFFPGTRNLRWAAERGAAFAKRIAAGGRGDVLFFCGASLEDWLRSLPKPTGVFAAWDGAARLVVDACKSAGIGVPEQVGVLGVDDDEDICEFSVPSISSVVLDVRRAGYVAARDLDLQMRSVSAMHRVAYGAKSVVKRSSTALEESSTDALVTRALEFIAINAGGVLSVSEVADAMKVNRRLLERRFEEAGRGTVFDAVREARFKRVTSLLVHTRRTTEEIADECGFSSASYLISLFRKRYGMTMGEYRSRNAAQNREDRHLMR